MSTFPLSQKDFLILLGYDSSKALCLLGAAQKTVDYKPWIIFSPLWQAS